MTEVETKIMAEENKNERGTTDVLMKGGKLYHPSEDIVKNANVQNYEKVYRDAEKDPVKFWTQAAEELFWHKKWNCFENNLTFF